ncbi:adhesion G protein-coupled receptor E2 [Elysia marginata]|uniref:Adhesion G protein-coupled receptor E2 n=1 Tax=Elysia marginata TaxID=1093978 RepID=A0AAV4G1P0_9GAST|nr:adhesion G protein-coupled receptor E2 [Elysia marginata]
MAVVVVVVVVAAATAAAAAVVVVVVVVVVASIVLKIEEEVVIAVVVALTEMGKGDECKEQPDLCKQYELKVCVNSPGSYYCKCKTGYRLNNTNGKCHDFDECKPEFYPNDVWIHRNNCSELDSRCKNVEGSFKCECIEGYIQLGSFNCKKITRCSISGEPCVGNNFCKTIDTVGTLEHQKCVCREGYRPKRPGDNLNCRDIDECAEKSDNCDICTSTCNNTKGSYFCRCHKGHMRVNEFQCKGQIERVWAFDRTVEDCRTLSKEQTKEI